MAQQYTAELYSSTIKGFFWLSCSKERWWNGDSVSIQTAYEFLRFCVFFPFFFLLTFMNFVVFLLVHHNKSWYKREGESLIIQRFPGRFLEFAALSFAAAPSLLGFAKVNTWLNNLWKRITFVKTFQTYITAPAPDPRSPPTPTPSSLEQLIFLYEYCGWSEVMSLQRLVFGSPVVSRNTAHKDMNAKDIKGVWISGNRAADSFRADLMQILQAPQRTN